MKMKGNDVKKKSSLRSVVKVISALTGLFVAYCLFVLLSDVAITKEANEWFGTPRQIALSENENAFYQISGFCVPEGMDSELAAIAWVDSVNLQILGNPEDDKLKNFELPKDSLFAVLTKVRQSGNSAKAVRRMIAQRDSLEAICEQAGFLEDRFQRISKMKAFETPVIPYAGASCCNVLPLLQYLSFRNIWLVKLYDEGQHARALEMLAENMAVARMIREQSDNLLLSISANVMIQRNLEWGVERLLDWSQEPAQELLDYVDQLSLMSSESYSLRKEMHYEGWMAYNSLIGIIDPSGEHSDPKHAPYLVAKPNATANLIALSYGKLADFSELSASEYAAQRGKQLYSPRWTEYLRSMMGAAQAQSANAFKPYCAMSHTINGYMILLKAKSAVIRQNVNKEDVPEFLAKNKGEFYDCFTKDILTWDQDTNMLSFTWDEKDGTQKNSVVLHYNNVSKL